MGDRQERWEDRQERWGRIDSKGGWMNRKYGRIGRRCEGRKDARSAASLVRKSERQTGRTVFLARKWG